MPRNPSQVFGQAPASVSITIRSSSREQTTFRVYGSTFENVVSTIAATLSETFTQDEEEEESETAPVRPRIRKRR